MKLVLLLSLFCNRRFYFVDNNFQRVHLHLSKASLLFSKMYSGRQVLLYFFFSLR